MEGAWEVREEEEREEEEGECEECAWVGPEGRVEALGCCLLSWYRVSWEFVESGSGGG